jgi:hypothetical protein
LLHPLPYWCARLPKKRQFEPVSPADQTGQTDQRGRAAARFQGRRSCIDGENGPPAGGGVNDFPREMDPRSDVEN